MNVNSKEIHQWYREYLGKDITRTYLFNSSGRIELSASGMYVAADDGKQYLDLFSGYGVFSLGHKHPEVCEAVIDQLGRMPMSTKGMFNPKAAELAYRLVSQLPNNEPRNVYLCNGGAEAVEAALKLSISATGRSRLVAIESGFSGKTLGALSVMHKIAARGPFLAVLHDNVAWIPRDDFQAMESAITPDVAAVILEPVQGEGGIHVLKPDYLSAISSQCQKNGALLIADEIQCGLGRTGKFSFTEYASGCRPDIFCFAKALGGGVVPAAATVYNQHAGSGIQGKPTLLTNTFGGNQLACVAAIKTLEIIERDQLTDRARTLGKNFMRGLCDLQNNYPDLIEEVRGVGLMIGIECCDTKRSWTGENIAGRVITESFKQGVLLAPALCQHRVIRIEPPLILELEHIQLALYALERAFAATRAAINQQV